MWVLIPAALGAGMLLLANWMPSLVVTEEVATARGMLIHHDSLISRLLEDEPGKNRSDELPVSPLFRQSGSWQSALFESSGGTVLLTWPAEHFDPSLIRALLGKDARLQSPHHTQIQIGTIKRQNATVALFADLSLRGVPEHLPNGTPAIGSLLP